MKTLKVTSRFKQDLKRIQNNPRRIANVETVLKRYSPKIRIIRV